MPDLFWSQSLRSDLCLHSMGEAHAPSHTPPDSGICPAPPFFKCLLYRCNLWDEAARPTAQGENFPSTRHLWEETAPRVRGPIGPFPESRPRVAEVTAPAPLPVGHRALTPLPLRHLFYSRLLPPLPPQLSPDTARSRTSCGHLKSWLRSSQRSSLPENPREPLRPAPGPCAWPARVAASPCQASYGTVHLCQGPGTTGSPPP